MHIYINIFDYCVLSGFHIFMETVNNLPKYISIRDSRIHLFEVFSLSPLHSAGSLNCVSSLKWIVEHSAVWEMEAYYIITKHSNWILCQTKLNFYYDLAKNALAAYCCEWNAKKNNNDNSIYGNDDECINFINYVILIHLNGIFFQNKTFFSSHFSLQGNWEKKKNSIDICQHKFHYAPCSM